MPIATYDIKLFIFAFPGTLPNSIADEPLILTAILEGISERHVWHQRVRRITPNYTFWTQYSASHNVRLIFGVNNLNVT